MMRRETWLALVALVGLSGGWAFGDYAATQGAGTNFQSFVNSGVHSAGFVAVDSTGVDATDTTLHAVKVSVVSATGLADGSTSAGQTFSKVGCNAVSSAPSYTNGQTDPCVMTLRGAQWFNIDAFGGTAVTIGQKAMTASIPVVLSSDQASIPVAATLAAETTKVIGTTRVKDASGNDYFSDPCQRQAKTYTPISITTATTTRIVAPSASNRTYICHIFLTSAAADNIGIVEGTGGTCGTGTAGVIGGTTAANGPNFAANSGFAVGNGGFAVAATAGTNVDLCLITSAATPLAGHIAWVQSP